MDRRAVAFLRFRLDTHTAINNVFAARTAYDKNLFTTLLPSMLLRLGFHFINWAILYYAEMADSGCMAQNAECRSTRILLI